MKKYELSISDRYRRRNTTDFESKMRLAWDGAVDAMCGLMKSELTQSEQIKLHINFKNWLESYKKRTCELHDMSERSRLKTRAEKIGR